MKNRILSVLIAFMFLFGTISAFAEETKEETTETSYRMMKILERLSAMTPEKVQASYGRYSDMAKHWGRNSIGKLTELGVISGCGDGTFKPDDTLKVDEFIKMIVRAMGHMPDVVLSSDWSRAYIDIAKVEGLIGEEEFTDYKRPVTREEAAKIVYLAAMKKEPAAGSSLDDLIRINIRDFAAVDSRYVQDVISCYSLGLLNGTPEFYFLPRKTLSRAEGSTVIIRFLDIKERTPFKPENGCAIELNDYSMERVLVGDDDYEQYNPQRYVICMPEKRDEIRTANVIKDSLGKSKGYGYVVYAPGGQGCISASFFDSMQKFFESSYDSEMGITIEMGDGFDHSYYVVIHQPDRVKELHRDLVVEMFESLFENDGSKAMAVFDKFIEFGINQSGAKDEIFCFNKRKLRVYKLDYDIRFAMQIYPKKD